MEPLPSLPTHRDRLATVVHRRIRLDRASIEEGPLHKMLTLIDDHLFAPSLNVSWAKEQVGILDNSTMIYFHIRLSLTPRRYIEAGRIDVATALLALTRAPIWQIAEMLGWSGMPTFSRAFHRYWTLRPRKLRRHYQEMEGTIVEPAQRVLRRALDGQTEVRMRHGVAITKPVKRLRPLAHVLAAVATRTETEQRAVTFLVRALRLLELGLDPRGIRALAAIAASTSPEDPIVSVDGEALTDLLDDRFPGRIFLDAMCRELDRVVASSCQD